MSYAVPPFRDEPSRDLLGDWNPGGEATDEPEPDGGESRFAPPATPPTPTPAAPESPADTQRAGGRFEVEERRRAAPSPAFGGAPRGRESLLGSTFHASLPFHHFSLGESDPPDLDPGSLIAPTTGPPRGSGGVSPAFPTPSTEPRPPRPGDTLAGFRLVTELGRGAFARVFLAEQLVLGGRPVVLKVSKAEGDEPQMLARLQHAHIVPILSVHDDPETGLRLLCMPYLGGANLGQVLEAAGGRSASEDDRRSLVDALDEVSLRLHRSGRPPLEPRSPHSRSGSDRTDRGSVDPRRRSIGGPTSGTRGPLSLPGLARDSYARLQSLWDRLAWRSSGRPRDQASLDHRDFDQPARQFLRQANGIQAAVWIVARLAEGLEHAHSRGLLHRDLKPSNILIAGDGTPMLLDFNLSTTTEPESSAESERAMLGGTLPYMSPEHLDAFHPDGQTAPGAVDERSDIYSLGLILFEMIAGEHPFPEPPAGVSMLDVLRLLAEQRKRSPRIREVRPDTPWSLDAIVAKCLDPDPSRRYGRARDFAEDLNRFLDDLPNLHAPEPSPRERLAKWARRNPRLCSASSVGTVFALLLLALGGLVGLINQQWQASNARLKLHRFRTDLETCRFLLNVGSGPINHLSEGVKEADRIVRDQDLAPSGDLRPDSWIGRLTRAEQAEVRSQTAEIMTLAARAWVALANSDGRRKAALKAAVAALDRAERLDPSPPAALYADRARYHAALGDADAAAADRRAEATRRPTSSREFLLLGGARLAEGDPIGAEPALLKALELDPKSFWGLFLLGNCHVETGRHAAAAGDFLACVALQPNFAWPYLNRGVALARDGRLGEAREAYRAALRVNGRFAEAWLNLGLVDLELDELVEAEDALGRATALGLNDPGTLAALAEAKGRRGDPAGASRMFDQLLDHHPDDLPILLARGFWRRGFDPDAARADFERVLALDPRNARALYGQALLVRGSSPRDALRLVDAALDAMPGFLDALQLRALLRARLGETSAIDDVERLIKTETPHRLYNAACALALLSESAGETRQAERAVSLLGRALDLGFPIASAVADPDLRALHARRDYRDRIERASRPPVQRSP